MKIAEGSGQCVIDVAQIEGRGDFASALGAAIEQALSPPERVMLDEDFRPYADSCVWRFNQAFWRYLSVWQRVTGKSYQRALPKGKSESHHEQFIVDAAQNFAGHVRELQREGLLRGDEEVWFHEKAPGSGEFAAGLLDQVREHFPDLYGRLRVVLSDASSDTLGLTARELERRGHLPERPGIPQIFFRQLVGDVQSAVTKPDGAAVSLEGRFIYYRHANFFDQLPTRLFARRKGAFYEVHVRAHVPKAALDELESRHGVALAELLAVVEGNSDLNQFDPERQRRTLAFWGEFWNEVKLQERYVAVGDLENYHDHGSEVAAIFRDYRDLRFVTSDVAIASLFNDLRLLDHRRGYACFTDVFLQRPADFTERWIELAKYDNGVWVGTNAVLMSTLLEKAGYAQRYHPVELTLGEPTPVYTLSVRAPDAERFVITPELIQGLTGIERGALSEVAVTGLSRRQRNNLRALGAALGRIARERDWSWRMLSEALDLTALTRELYYRVAAREMSAGTPFVKLVTLIAELLDRYPQERVRVDCELGRSDLVDLANFLDCRPPGELPLDLIEPGRNLDNLRNLRLRLPTLARRLKAGDFVLLAETDLPRGQPVEALRRRVLQLQSHVDAVSLTSGRLADPRFMRSRELLESPLLDALQADRLVVTVEMRDRRAADLERDLRAFEAHGVRNFFILTGDFERNSRWWLDSVNGIRIADRLRNGEGADGRPLANPGRFLIAGALALSPIPDLLARVERDVELKARAGVDVLFSQPVYDLGLAREVLGVIRDRGLSERVHVVLEIFPMASMALLRSLTQAPGILVPNAMAAAYRRIERNVTACWTSESSATSAGEDSDAAHRRFVERVFRDVPEIPGYEGFFSPAFAARLCHAAQEAAADARCRAPRGREDEAALRAARESAILEVGFGLAEVAIAELADHPAVSGFLFVARNGRELERLCAEARRRCPK